MTQLMTNQVCNHCRTVSSTMGADISSVKARPPEPDLLDEYKLVPLKKVSTPLGVPCITAASPLTQNVASLTRAVCLGSALTRAKLRESMEIYENVLTCKDRLVFSEFDEVFGHLLADPEEHFKLFCNNSRIGTTPKSRTHAFQQAARQVAAMSSNRVSANAGSNQPPKAPGLEQSVVALEVFCAIGLVCTGGDVQLKLRFVFECFANRADKVRYRGTPARRAKRFAQKHCVPSFPGDAEKVPPDAVDGSQCVRQSAWQGPTG